MRFTILAIALILFISCGENEPEEQQVTAGISINDLSITESDQQTKIVLDITLSKKLPEQVVIDYTTEDGTAVATEDYYTESGQIVFAPEDTRESVEIIILGDNEQEEDEVFYVKLTPRGENITLEKDIATITIADDDAPPTSGELVIPTAGYTTPESYEGMTLVWSDEFDGESLNTDDWTYEIGGHGWGNNELEYYTNKNTSIVEGNLVIEARKESQGGRLYTSSRIVTMDKQEFQYGRIDIRAALPYGQGIWPALWMLGSNFKTVGWPACGEIDIMEMIGGGGREKTVHGTVHWSNGGDYASFGGHYNLGSGTFSDEFHVFSILWDENEIIWYVDDVQFHVIDIRGDNLSEFRQPFFFIFNVAVGGNWPGNPNGSTLFPQRMIVDYVRVFQPK